MRRWMALVLLVACDAGTEGSTVAVDGVASAADAGADPAAHDTLAAADSALPRGSLDAGWGGDGGAQQSDAAQAAEAGAADTGGLADGSVWSPDAGASPSDAGPVAPGLDVWPVTDAGPTGGHTTPDALAAADAGPAPGDAAADVSWAPPGEETTKALLIGRWQMVAVADSGNPKEPVPPGAQFFAFRSDQTLASTCEAPGGAPWTLSADGAVLSVWFSPDAAIEWTILLLTAQEFVFYEGGDVFYHERTEDCP
ncbi:MAG: hypothetical protein AMXMBFR64_41280 [Myxococcales bacterium]